MRNFMPAVVAAMSFGAVLTVGMWQLGALANPPQPSSAPASAWPGPVPSGSNPATRLPAPEQGNGSETQFGGGAARGDDDAATAACEESAQAGANCIRREYRAPQRPGGTYRPDRRTGPQHQLASQRPITAADFS